MPLIIPKELHETWLHETDPGLVKELVKPYPEELMADYTVGQIRGNNRLGNVLEAAERKAYQAM